MTINNCIKDLLIQREDFTYELGSEEIDFMIAIMKKYQKIEQLINNAKDSDGAVKYNWLYEQIKEVVEDGTN